MQKGVKKNGETGDGVFKRTVELEVATQSSMNVEKQKTRFLSKRNRRGTEFKQKHLERR